MIKYKPKRCKICKSEFMPKNSMIKHCSPECGIELLRTMNSKRIRKELVAYRNKNKSLSKWIQEAQVEINSYVRVRDHDKACISCNRLPGDIHLRGSAFHAGHYRGRGSAPHLRFYLPNIQKQCAYCNEHLSGNVVEYRIGLIKRIGIDKVEAIEVNNGYKKFTREDCERIKRIFKKKTRMRKKRLGID